MLLRLCSTGEAATPAAGVGAAIPSTWRGPAPRTALLGMERNGKGGGGGEGASAADGRAAVEEAGYKFLPPASANGSEKGSTRLAVARCSPPPAPPLACDESLPPPPSPPCVTSRCGTNASSSPRRRGGTPSLFTGLIRGEPLDSHPGGRPGWAVKSRGATGRKGMGIVVGGGRRSDSGLPPLPPAVHEGVAGGGGEPRMGANGERGG